MKRPAIIQDLINAYEDHSRTDFDAHLKRLEEMLRYTGPTRDIRLVGRRPDDDSLTPEEAKFYDGFKPV